MHEHKLKQLYLQLTGKSYPGKQSVIGNIKALCGEIHHIITQFQNRNKIPKGCRITLNDEEVTNIKKTVGDAAHSIGQTNPFDT